jgi:hypothetical protein
VVLEDLDLTSQIGIRCNEATDLAFRNVMVQAQEEPLFSVNNVSGLQTVDLTLQKITV